MGSKTKIAKNYLIHIRTKIFKIWWFSFQICFLSIPYNNTNTRYKLDTSFPTLSSRGTVNLLRMTTLQFRFKLRKTLAVQKHVASSINDFDADIRLPWIYKLNISKIFQWVLHPTSTYKTVKQKGYLMPSLKSLNPWKCFLEKQIHQDVLPTSESFKGRCSSQSRTNVTLSLVVIC